MPKSNRGGKLYSKQQDYVMENKTRWDSSNKKKIDSYIIERFRQNGIIFRKNTLRFIDISDDLKQVIE